jgi:hypothetical protein
MKSTTKFWGGTNILVGCETSGVWHNRERREPFERIVRGNSKVTAGRLRCMLPWAGGEELKSRLILTMSTVNVERVGPVMSPEKKGRDSLYRP